MFGRVENVLFVAVFVLWLTLILYVFRHAAQIG